jgi:hypothetical protein
MDYLKLILVLAILALAAYLIYRIIKAVSGLSVFGTGSLWDKVFGDFTVVTPKSVQDFIGKPANQPGGFTPWAPEDDPDPYDDGSGTPTWIKKKADSF